MDGGASQQVGEGEEDDVMSETKEGDEKAEETNPCEPSVSHLPAKKKRRDDGECLRPLERLISSASC